MVSFVTVHKDGQVTRLLQEVKGSYLNGDQNVIVCYYVNTEGYVEFDGSAHVFSAVWLAQSIGRWTDNGDTIQKWSN